MATTAQYLHCQWQPQLNTCPVHNNHSSVPVLSMAATGQYLPCQCSQLMTATCVPACEVKSSRVHTDLLDKKHSNLLLACVP